MVQRWRSGAIPEHKCEWDLWAQAEGKIISE